MMNTGNQPKLSNNGLLTTIAYGIKGEVTYALEGSVFIAGSAMQWLRDGMRVIERSPESETMANASTNENEVYVVPALQDWAHLIGIRKLVEQFWTDAWNYA
ncbi:Glycerol kinase [Weissella viridescens]|uniref:Glycerol kinase n=1 Tax=Weissella viridescens TaxID=1629 RepID=A0A380P2D9_WEIVI|nr:Glycerol kinase [Weissella viridescens]